MKYVQYFNKGVISGDLIEACGDRAVIILDARERESTHHDIARTFNGCNRPHYEAYQLFKGDTFTRSTPVSEIIPL